MRFVRPIYLGLIAAVLAAGSAAWAAGGAPAPVVPVSPVTPAAASAAAELLAAGRRALESGKNDQAVLLLERACELTPADDEAQLLLVTARRTLAESQGQTVLRRLSEMRGVAEQKALVEVQEALRKAKAAAAVPEREKDLELAAGHVQRAREILEANRGYLTEVQYQRQKARADEVTEWLAARRDEWERTSQKNRQEQFRQSESQRLASVDRRRRARIAMLKTGAQRLTADGRYDAALQMVQEIRQLDPKDAWAADQVTLLSQTKALRGAREIEQDMAGETGRTWADVWASSVPWYDEIVYPSDWVSKTVRRRSFLGGEEEPGVADANRKTREALKTPISVNFEDTPLTDVLGELRVRTGVNLHPRWRVLATGEVMPETKVTVRMKGVAGETILKTVLDSISSGEKKVVSQLDGGVVVITLNSDQGSMLATRVYDIRDLLTVVPDFRGPRIDVTMMGSGNNNSSNQDQGLFNSGSGQNAGSQNGQDSENENTRLSKKAIIDSMMKMIASSVEPGTWQTEGEAGVGGPGRMQIMQGNLLITHTPSAHEAVVRLLRRIRQMQSTQVLVEGRELQVERGFMERIGVDVDLTFKVGPGGVFRKLLFDNNQITQNSSDFVTAISGVGNAALLSALPPAMTVGGTFLENVQVDFLLQATQASIESRTLDAPRLLLQNGQTSYIMIGRTQAYVSSIGTTVSNNVAVATPVVSWLTIGRMLEVTAVISEDLRYVTMTVRYDSTPSGNIVTVPYDLGEIMLPTITRRTVETTVTCPDGGSVLLGGITESTSETREIGVPILSKVPVLNRAAANRSMIRDESRTYYLISPKIILPPEREDKQFPPPVRPVAATR